MKCPTVKWQPFLIPEHRKRIAQFYESQVDVQQPELDEQFMEQMQETNAESIESGLEVSVTYHSNKRFNTVTGTICKVDPHIREITLNSNEDLLRLVLTT